MAHFEVDVIQDPEEYGEVVGDNTPVKVRAKSNNGKEQIIAIYGTVKDGQASFDPTVSEMTLPKDGCWEENEELVVNREGVPFGQTVEIEVYGWDSVDSDASDPRKFTFVESSRAS